MNSAREALCEADVMLEILYRLTVDRGELKLRSHI